MNFDQKIMLTEELHVLTEELDLTKKNVLTENHINRNRVNAGDSVLR